MDSRLQRRIKWWKEQLRKKTKHKREHSAATVKEKLKEQHSIDEINDVPVKKRLDRKRKRKEVESEDALFSEPKKKKKRKGDDAIDDSETHHEDVTDSTVKKKYILFIGNIPFSASVEDIIQHFQRAGIKVKNFRLLTKKSGSSKGCGFMELKSSKQLQAGLRLHHTKFDGRTINVELSCGGGGKNEKRREKIKAKNKRLQKQRTKKHRTSKIELTDETLIH